MERNSTLPGVKKLLHVVPRARETRSYSTVDLLVNRRLLGPDPQRVCFPYPDSVEKKNKTTNLVFRDIKFILMKCS